MHTLKIRLEDNVFEKVMNFLHQLPKHEVSILEDNVVELSELEKEIQKGLDSGVSNKTHAEILKEIKQKYV